MKPFPNLTPLLSLTALSLTALSLAMPVALAQVVDCPTLDNMSPEIPPEILNAPLGYQRTVASGATTTVAVRELASDADQDALDLSLDTVETGVFAGKGPVTGDNGGEAQVSEDGGVCGADVPCVQYRAPSDVTAEISETFHYLAADRHGGQSDPATPGKLTFNITPAQVCHPILGGTCFGQTWDGRWWTLDDELLGRVKTAAGARLALFVPSKDAYIKAPAVPAVGSTPVIAILSGSAFESFWGCGSMSAPLAARVQACLGSTSLRAGITYMLRLPVPTGVPSSTTIMLNSASARDTYRSWYYALSDNPAVGLYRTSANPPFVELTGTEPSGCRGFGGYATFVRGTCRYLVPPAPAMLYLKIQAAPGRAFEHGAWTEPLAGRCGSDVFCRMYTRAW